MRRIVLIIAFATISFTANAQDNLRHFLGLTQHPVCGINPAFDGQPRNVPTPLFASCRTMALGISLADPYPDPGVNAIAKLIIAISETAGWEAKFGPLSTLPLNCRLNVPLGLGPTPNDQTANWPICTLRFVTEFLVKYNQQPVVQGFKKFERNLNQINLSQQSNITKIRQAEAIVRASGGQATFEEIGALIQ